MRSQLISFLFFFRIFQRYMTELQIVSSSNRIQNQALHKSCMNIIITYCSHGERQWGVKAKCVNHLSQVWFAIWQIRKKEVGKERCELERSISSNHIDHIFLFIPCVVCFFILIWDRSVFQVHTRANKKSSKN